MPYYITAQGEQIDVSGFEGNVQVVYDGMRRDYETNRYQDWIPFHDNWHRQAISEAKREFGARWFDHPLRRIELDLATTVGVRHGQLEGTPREVSDIFVDD
tara:strand:+ start:103 stop:405 length:303 start_codon:yes stop_codon:yes gene_type:complete